MKVTILCAEISFSVLLLDLIIPNKLQHIKKKDAFEDLFLCEFQRCNQHGIILHSMPFQNARTATLSLNM